MTRSTRDAHNQTYVRKLSDGLSLKAEVPLCVFLGHPLQIKVALTLKDGTSGGDATAVNRNRNVSNATADDIISLLDAVAIQPCSRCSTPAFDPATVETNRDGLCEACFLKDLRQRSDADFEKKRRQTARRDREMKSRGMKYRIVVVFRRSEYDYEKQEWYDVSAPSKLSTAARLRREGATLRDFEVIKL